jgi:hypothetical protein
MRAELVSSAVLGAAFLASACMTAPLPPLDPSEIFAQVTLEFES